MLGDGVGGVGGDARDGDAEPRGGGEVDVVETGAAEQDQPGRAGGQRRQHLGVDAIVHEHADRGEAGTERRGLAREPRLEEGELVAGARRQRLDIRRRQGILIVPLGAEDPDLHGLTLWLPRRHDQDGTGG